MAHLQSLHVPSPWVQEHVYLVSEYDDYWPDICNYQDVCVDQNFTYQQYFT